jgi:hypothetical protein
MSHFLAIVLSENSAFTAWQTALHHDLLFAGWKEHCHHVTLALGLPTNTAELGKWREVVLTHYGKIEGRVTAFKVSGADDSKNETPHLTIAVNSDEGAKPRESNDITEWFPLDNPVKVQGTVELCTGGSIWNTSGLVEVN